MAAASGAPSVRRTTPSMRHCARALAAARKTIDTHANQTRLHITSVLESQCWCGAGCNRSTVTFRRTCRCRSMSIAPACHLSETRLSHADDERACRTLRSPRTIAWLGSCAAAADASRHTALDRVRTSLIQRRMRVGQHVVDNGADAG